MITGVAVINVNVGKDVIIGAVDTCGKLATCVNDTSAHRLSTQVELVRHLAMHVIREKK